MTGLAHEQFARILAEVAAAASFEEAREIVRAAGLAGDLDAISEDQLAQLYDAVRRDEP